MAGKTLFDDNTENRKIISKEAGALETLKDLDEKIAAVVAKIKILKEENGGLQNRISELEHALAEREAEIKKLSSEKNGIKDQIEGLLTEIESMGL